MDNEEFNNFIVNISEGNPGAITVLLELEKAVYNEYTALLRFLQENDIKGSQLWIIYNDENQRDIVKTLAVLRKYMHEAAAKPEALEEIKTK